ncbi:MAG: hypothetical protein HYR94_10015 [Chloroflexi bacterium]|nr:hypothetical protein [Chloroflexota bacterium]
MSDEVTLAQLAAEMAQLRRQIEIVNQRLDMIYGAVTRLTEAQNSPASTAPRAEQTQAAPASGMFAPEMMMDPSSMLDSLRQFAVSVGLDVSQETVDRLKSHPPVDETNDDQK